MKVFIMSDIHSFYDEMIKALEEKGFEQNNKEHWLVLNGDGFDRGNKSQEVKDFLDATNNKTCVIGNHELLLLEAINRGEFLYHDLTNGTLDAAIQLSGGYKAYPVLELTNKAKELFKRDSEIHNNIGYIALQKEIIVNLINTGIVEWIVDNFYVDVYDEKRGVHWNSGKTKFKIVGKPRYYLMLGNNLITHGFFPAPGWTKSYVKKGNVIHATLPPDYDILEESSQEMWEEYGSGVWSNTPYWLKKFYKYDRNLENLYDYIVEKNIKDIYIGHWTKRDLENMVVSVSMTPTYMKYQDKLPTWHFTDGEVVTTHNVIVETFLI